MSTVQRVATDLFDLGVSRFPSLTTSRPVGFSVCETEITDMPQHTAPIDAT